MRKRNNRRRPPNRFAPSDELSARFDERIERPKIEIIIEAPRPEPFAKRVLRDVVTGLHSAFVLWGIMTILERV